MLMEVPEAEVKLTDERVRELYVSKWTFDNLTALIMDIHHGDLGISETVARVKAQKILDWLRVINQIEIPQKRE
jgi:hypothetical protein